MRRIKILVKNSINSIKMLIEQIEMKHTIVKE